MARLENLLGAQALALADRVLAGASASTGAGASRSECAALITLLAHHGRTVGWLSDVLGLTSSGGTRLVERLVAAGWVERSAGDDARQRQLALTAPGRARADSMLAGRQAALAEAVAVLSATERADLEALLDKVVAGLAGDRLAALRVCGLCDRVACCETGEECPLQHTVVDG